MLVNINLILPAMRLFLIETNARFKVFLATTPFFRITISITQFFHTKYEVIGITRNYIYLLSIVASKNIILYLVY